MKQSNLNFGRLYLVDEEHTDAWRATEAAAHEVTMLVAAGASKLDPGDLTKTFQPNSGRHLRLRTAMAIGAVAGTDARRAIITPIARLFGFEIERHKPIDDREARILMEAKLRAIGDQLGVGDKFLEEALGGRR